MPELPEVETVMRGLTPVWEGQRFTRVIANRPDLRRPLPEALGQRLTGAIVTRLDRRAKYGLVETDRGDTLHAIRERIHVAASSRGAEIGETEVVGLLPERALHAGGNPAALQISGGWERVVLDR